MTYDINDPKSISNPVKSLNGNADLKTDSEDIYSNFLKKILIRKHKN
ncbi:hypothetical protein [uncultured Methanobrevibacter sp.]|nr:hypothetical protein [uncultured Methanobrevibacter sp.]